MSAVSGLASSKRERCPSYTNIAVTRGTTLSRRENVPRRAGERDSDIQLRTYVVVGSERKRDREVCREPYLDVCVTPVAARHAIPCPASGERPPGEYYRNKCASLHNTTTSNSGRFDGARYRPLAKRGRRQRERERERERAGTKRGGKGYGFSLLLVAVEGKGGKTPRGLEAGSPPSFPVGLACIIYAAFRWPMPNEETASGRCKPRCRQVDLLLIAVTMFMLA